MKRFNPSFYRIIVFILSLSLLSGTLIAQEPVQDYSRMTRHEALQIPYETLIDLPLDQLMILAEIVGVSMDELLQMALNMQVTTASKRAETVFESPLSTTVITKEEIEMSGATTIEEVFRLVPGMIVREKTNGVFDIHMRGFDNVPPDNFSHFSENMISLVMIDGIPVYNNVTGGTFWETLPVSLNQVERVDIIRGPSSALYGPNAVSGVINIITKTPEDKKFYFSADQRAGNFNSYIGDMYSSFVINDKMSLSLSGRYDIRDRFHDLYYSYREGEYIDVEDSIQNIVGDYYLGPSEQTFPKGRAKELFAGNLNFFYDASDDMHFRVTGGYQDSKVNTVFFENIATPFSSRTSSTGFANLQADVKGFHAIISYQAGTQNLSDGMVRPIIEYDMNSFNSALEYSFDFEKITIRPGVNYQKANYNDAPYEKAVREQRGSDIYNGLFHGNKSTSLIGGSLRADYRPVEKLRLIGAARVDRFDYIDDLYLSYQAISSYQINENHLLRATLSRANRGAFVGNLHADFRNPIMVNQPIGIIPEENYEAFKQFLLSDQQTEGLVPLLPPMVVINGSFNQYYIGSTNSNRDLELLTIDVLELGWRGKLTRNLQADIEVFYGLSKNFDALVSYESQTIDTYYSLTDLTGMEGMEEQYTPFPRHITINDTMYYENLPLTGSQFGVSASVNMQVARNAMVKVFGTWQQTKLEHHITILKDTVDITHKNTPSFFGGLNVYYSPTPKLNLYGGGYFYTSQVYNRYWRPLSASPEAITTARANAEDKINTKAIVNLRVSYKIWNESNLYIEGKNLLFDNNREFGFADPIKTMIFVGLNVQL